MFESYLAPAAGVTAHRDLACAEIWDISLQRSRRRRELAEQHRRSAPKTRSTAAAVSAALLVSPLLPFASAGAQERGGAHAAPAQPRARHADGTIVKRGDVNATVTRVQRQLGVGADGIFGPLTEGAVKRFQGRAGVTRTGTVGVRTWRALFSAPVAAASAGGGTAVPRDRAGAPKRAAAAPPPASGACGATLVAPVAGSASSGFGGARNHGGIDITAPVGTPVRAAACGTVTLAASQSGYGNMVCIRHSAAFSTCYAHLSEMSVQPGARVAAGQLVGRVGMTGRTTGAHLHFETRVGGQAQDPAPYLAGARAIA